MTDTTAADVEALRLAQTMDAATVRAVLDKTTRAVERRLAGSTEETTARADALARALRAVNNGLDVTHAVNAAVRDAVADAVRRAATVDMVSLDATTADATTTLADLIDSGAPGTARLSHYDTQQGVWRGVARVPHPDDVTRPAEMLAPEQMQETARDRLTAAARRLLDLTIAANVAAAPAADAEWTALLDALTRDHDRAEAMHAPLAARDRRRAAVLATIKQAKQARRDARKTDSHNTYRPRTAEVIEAMTGQPVARGAATQRVARDQESAVRAYWTHRDALAAEALAAWTERIDAAAADQAQRYARRQAWQGADPLAEPHAARMTTHRAIHSARRARAERARAALTAARPMPTGQQPADRPGPGSPYTATNGATCPVRPRTGAPYEWTPGHPLPGPSRKPSARLPQPVAPTADPLRPRSHALPPLPADAITRRPQAHPLQPSAARIPGPCTLPTPPTHDAATVARIDAARARVADAAAKLRAVQERDVPTPRPRSPLALAHLIGASCAAVWRYQSGGAPIAGRLAARVGAAHADAARAHTRA